VVTVLTSKPIVALFKKWPGQKVLMIFEVPTDENLDGCSPDLWLVPKFCHK
jgi:hypothetical protein